MPSARPCGLPVHRLKSQALDSTLPPLEAPLPPFQERRHAFLVVSTQAGAVEYRRHGAAVVIRPSKPQPSVPVIPKAASAGGIGTATRSETITRLRPCP